MRIIEWLTGARRGEVAQTIYSFLALFFLLLSYYLVKPLRNSQFLSSFDPNLLPLFYLITPLISLIVTKIFNALCDRLPKYHLISATFVLFMACKLVFLVYLPRGGRMAMVIFYFWASVYFLLAVALLWSCINTIFSPDQGERSFGFVALGGIMGNIIGAEVSSWIARSNFKNLALLVACLAMGAALGLILLAIRTREACQESVEHAPPQDQELAHPVSSKGWADLVELWSNQYIRGITVMVFALALFNTLVDFQSQKMIDSTYSTRNYHEHFQWLPQSPAQGQEFLQILRKLPEGQQDAAIAAFLPQPADQTRFKQSLKAYADHKETDIRDFFPQTYKYQGLLGILVLLGVSRLLFRHLGLRFATMILPVFSMGMALALFFPLEILLLQGLMVIGGALNYSLNNATKELLYTITSEDVRFKLKPLIEGPVMRLGDVSASLIKLGLGIGLASFLKSPGYWVDWGSLLMALAVVLLWMVTIAYTGGHYDQLKNRTR